MYGYVVLIKVQRLSEAKLGCVFVALCNGFNVNVNVPKDDSQGESRMPPRNRCSGFTGGFKQNSENSRVHVFHITPLIAYNQILN